MPITELRLRETARRFIYTKKEVKRIGEPPLLGKETGGAVGKKEGPSCRLI